MTTCRLALGAPFDWEKRWEYDAWRISAAAEFEVAISEAGLQPQYVDTSSPSDSIFWWDRHLTHDEIFICEKATRMVLGELPEDVS
jgi:hypothetical protein